MNVILLLILFFMFTIVYTMTMYVVSYATRKKRNVTVDYSCQPTITVMLSCFNEGEAVHKTIESIVNSNYPVSKIQVIAFDDCSEDDSFEWMQLAATNRSNVIVHKNAYNLGKVDTLIGASKLATGEILVCTDSDTIFHCDAIRELAAAFVDSRVGAVGGVIGIVNANDSLLTQSQAIVYAMNFYLMKPIENLTHTVQCLGGPLIAMRLKLYRSLIPAILTNTFLGERATRGEDRFITQQVLLRGYKTIINYQARCWVGTPVTWTNYFKQQLRWRRSAIHQYLNTIVHMPTYLKRAGVIATIDSILPITSHMCWMAFLLYSLLLGSAPTVLATFCILKVFMAAFFGIVHNVKIGNYDPIQKLKNPVLAALVMILWSITSIFLVTPWAIATLDDGGWVTRQDGLGGNV